MDILVKQEEISLTQVAVYASVSFMVVSMLGIILYATCSRKYKLNWFEKNLLETADEEEKIAQSRDVMARSSLTCNLDNLSGSSKSLARGNASPTTSLINDDTTFWIPSQRPTSQGTNHTDESPPITPTSPTGSIKSVTLSIGSESVPIARSEKHMVLAMNPVRPKVASMHARLDHTKIDTSLYQSDGSIRESPQNSEDSRGTIHLYILYDQIAGILTIRLIEAHDLQPRDFSGTADPYAKVRLLPDKKNVWQTRIHKKTLNPVFDEDFVFEENVAGVRKRTIEILLYDFDAYSRHVCIGSTQIPLENLDLSDKVDIWKSLTSYADHDAKVDIGDIMVSLSFLPSAERLTVVVAKARNLRVVDDTRNASDPYVKVTLMSGNKKLKKRKTGVVRSTVNPVFNEALTFNVSRDIIKHCSLEFIVLHDSLLGANEVLGRTVIGNSAEVRPEEKILFDDMLHGKTANAQWIPLFDVKQI